MGTEFIKDMRELIAGWEAQHQVVQEKCNQLQDELDDLERKIQFGNESILEYMNLHNIEPTVATDYKFENLSNKSYPEMLKVIARKSNGFLKMSDAVEILYREKVGFDKNKIRHNVGNTLTRMCDQFTRIGRGQYQYTNGFQKEDKKRQKQATKRRNRRNSGVQKVVKELKEKNPQMTFKEVLNHLLETGYDFKGSKPFNAVNIVWSKLGYPREGKQQPLPITKATVVELPIDGNTTRMITAN